MNPLDTIVIELCLIFIAHYICDYWLQRSKDAEKKSYSFRHLYNHTIGYSTLMGVAVYVITGFEFITESAAFVGATVLFHTATDYFTSKLSSNYYKDGNRRAFFRTLGLDQLLHQIQLILTYYYIFMN